MLDALPYHEFLASKQARHKPGGFNPRKLPASLFGWQSDIVRWSVRLGRAAIWAGCGLGKTFMQLAWGDCFRRYANGPVLLLTPLAVGPQTVREARKLGIEDVVLCAHQDDANGAGKRAICVTNYQKLLKGHFKPESFAAVILDESSILKAYTGKTKRLLCESFAHTPYKLACTATPAPNDYMEIGNHAEFLGVMPSSEMLARWFIADQSQSGHYYIKGHAEADFWEWVASWAVCLDKPSDLGYSDEDFIMPELHLHQHFARVDATKGAQAGQFWRTQKLNATNLHAELRITAPERAELVASLVNGSSEEWAVWCNTDYEADELIRRIPDAVEVRGSQPDRVKEERLDAFVRGDSRVIITKPKIAGYGLNWQHCRNAAFVGLSHSYEDFLQAMSRLYRFGQKRSVNNHIVVAETEGDVLANIQRKHRENLDMRRALVLACNRTMKKERSLVRVEHQVQTVEGNEMHLGDSCEVVRTLPDAFVGFSIFSPPFSNLYIYSDAEADMGNSADDSEFLKHFGYLAPELLRITIPCRLCAVHCKDLPKYANRDDTAGLKDFPGDLVRVMEGAGWSYHSRVTIWKCPVVERERTNNNGLLHKTVRRDSSQLRQGMADFLLVFRRPPASDSLMSANPIERAAGFLDYVGLCDPRDEAEAGQSRHPSPYSRVAGTDPRWEELPDGRNVDLTPSVNIWQRYADPAWFDVSRLSPSQFRAAQLLLAAGMTRPEVADALGLCDTDAIWFDIDQMDVLNYKDAAGPQDERHICPLQLGLIRRAVQLWSNPGDVVCSPFAGIGSEGVVAVAEKRRFVGIELKETYWQRSIRHITHAVTEARQRGLFDGIDDRGTP